jgi:hypothetical protein
MGTRLAPQETGTSSVRPPCRIRAETAVRNRDCFTVLTSQPGQVVLVNLLSLPFATVCTFIWCIGVSGHT